MSEHRSNHSLNALPSESKSVLMIEDNTDVTEVLLMMLETYGYAATAIGNRNDALKAVMDKQFDHILMDFNVPGMSAKEFVQEVKRLSPGTQLVLMSASVLAERAARELGLSFWLAKPFFPDELIAVLKQQAPRAPQRANAVRAETARIVQQVAAQRRPAACRVGLAT